MRPRFRKQLRLDTDPPMTHLGSLSLYLALVIAAYTFWAECLPYIFRPSLLEPRLAIEGVVAIQIHAQFNV